MNTDLSFRANGEIKVSERSEKEQDGGGWSSTDLLEVVTNNLELRIGLRDEDVEEEEIFIELCEYHVENQETKRAFHTDLEAKLTLQDVKNLHAFLGYILATH